MPAACWFSLRAASAVYLVPLLVWALKRRSGAWVDDQGRQAINFQITVAASRAWEGQHFPYSWTLILLRAEP